jgi:hypothetical protein
VCLHLLGWSAGRLEGFVPTVPSSELGQKGFIISSICVKSGMVSTRGMLRWREIRDEKIIRNWQSHRKSNMHFRLRRNAHPLTRYQEIKLTICAQLPDSNIAVPSQGADKFQADRMMVTGGFFWQRRMNNSQARPLLAQTETNSRQCSSSQCRYRMTAKTIDTRLP